MRSGLTDKRRQQPFTQPHPTYHASSYIPNGQVYQHNGTQTIPDQPPNTPKRSFRLPGPAEGWSALFFLAIALYCVVYAVITADWVSHSQVLLYTPLAGLLIGLVIAKIPFNPQSFLHLIACCIGGSIAFVLTSLLAYHLSFLELWNYLLQAILGQINSQNATSNEVIFFFYLAFLCFFLGYFGSWLVYRARLPWLVTLVYCAIMLVNLNYVSQDFTWVVLLMLAALVLLIARIHVLSQISGWMSEGLYADHSWVRTITRRCMQVALASTAFVIIASIALPVYAQPESGKAFWLSAENAWINIVTGRISWNNLHQLGSSFQPSANFFGDQLQLTGNVSLPNGQTLEYVSSDKKGHYLQAFSYNQFDGYTWKNTRMTNGWTYEANTNLPLDIERPDAKTVTTEVKILTPPGGTKTYIFAPAEPSQFNVPVTLYSDSSFDGSTIAWVKSSPHIKGSRYTVLSKLPVDESNLTNIPLPENDRAYWLEDGYLNSLGYLYTDIPRNLSPNVRTITRNWTKDSKDTLSALKAIEKRLSDPTQFTYSLQNPPVPRGKNAVDVLLQTKQGYCTFYASTMAIMARLLSIPTRIVNGFNTGTFDAQRGVWVVEGKNAHSWVQAYFPGYGWIDFDPTPGFGINRNSTAQPAPGATVTPTTKPITPTAQATATKTATAKPQNEQTPNGNQTIGEISPFWLYLVSVLLVAACLFFVCALVVRWWRNLYTDNSAVASLYWRFCHLASWLGIGPKSWQTPYEYGQQLSQRFPQHASPLYKLTDLYVRDRWGAPRHMPQEHEVHNMQQIWPTLRSLLMDTLIHRRK